MNNNNNRGSELKNKIASKAASSIGGPLAGKAVEKLGKKNGNSDLISKKNSLNKSASGSDTDKAEGAKDVKEEAAKEKKGLPSSPSATMGDQAQADSDDINAKYTDYGKKLFALFSVYKVKIAIGLFVCVLMLIAILAIPIIVGSLGGTVIEFFTDLGDHLIGYVEKNNEKQMDKYYNKLKNTKEKQYRSKHVCIDENLITATLTVDLDALDFKKQQNSQTEPLGEDKAGYSDEDLEEDRPSMFYGDPDDANESADEVFDNEDHVFLDALMALTGSAPVDTDLAELAFDTEKEKQDYKKMRKEIQLLANMQIKTKRYGYDNDLRGIAVRDCRPIDDPEEEEKFLVTEENVDRFDPKGLNVAAYLNVNGGFISDSPQLVAKHDKRAFAAFFTKKSKEETNYEFYIYSPKDHEECSDTNGDGQEECEIVCNKKLPKNEYELSIGDLSNMEESVYYWNLVNSFIPNYYDEYLPDGDGREEAIKKIAEEIYLLYADLGQGQSCAAYDIQETICRSDEGADYYTGDNGGTGPINGSTNEFLNRIAPLAIEEMSRTGLDASVIMAQAALESSWGKSGLSSKYANYYGMTSGCINNSAYPPSQYRGTVLRPGSEFNNCTGNAFWDGTVVAMCNKDGGDCQWYRVYDSFENSTKDHNRLLLESSRYSNCNKYRDPQDQIQCIKNGGYATAPDYVSSVMSVINAHNLSKFDIGEWDGEYIEITEPLYTSNVCFDYGELSSASGDWANWLQGDPRWKDLVINTKTIGKVGCALTSVAVQIARSGVGTTVGANFNPGTFMLAHKANGGFSGNNIEWNVSDVAPNFQFVNNPDFTSISQLKSLVDQGYYLVLGVKNSGHWVAVDKVVGDTVYIYDSALRGGVRYTTANQYGVNTFTKVIMYKKIGN